MELTLRQLLTTSFPALFFMMKGWFSKYIRNIENNILNLNDSRFSEALLSGDSSFNIIKITSILNTTIEYIASYKRFEVPRFWFLLTVMHGCFIYLLLFLFISFSFFKFTYFHCGISHYCWLSVYTFLSCNFWIWFLVWPLALIFSVCKYIFSK